MVSSAALEGRVVCVEMHAAAVRSGERSTAAIINECSRIRDVSNSLQSPLGGHISSYMTHLNTKMRAEVKLVVKDCML